MPSNQPNRLTLKQVQHLRLMDYILKTCIGSKVELIDDALFKVLSLMKVIPKV